MNSVSPFQKQKTILISGYITLKGPETFHDNYFFTMPTVAITKINVYYETFPFFKYRQNIFVGQQIL